MKTFAWLCAFAAVACLAARGNIDVQNLDRSVRPSDDFFGYVNGIWVKTTTIPADQSRWGSFNELIDRNQQNLRTLCERASAVGDQGNPAERMVGDFYASGLDEAAIDGAGIDPLKFEFDRIDALKTPAEVFLEMAHLQSIGVAVGFGFRSMIDSKNSDLQIALVHQGGLGLPDRDYYLNPEEKAHREQYALHVSRTLKLLGKSDASADADTAAVMKIEIALAEVSRPRVDLRDPYKNYHKMTVAALGALTPGLDWPAYFAKTPAPAFAELNVAQPEFFPSLARLLSTIPVPQWQGYLRWHVIRHFSPYLSAPFVAEDFDFYRKTLTGAKQNQPRWKRVVTEIDGSVGEALGQLYVAAYFPPEAKASALKLVANLRSALHDRIENLEWMDAATKSRALAKLDLFTVKIGYPDRWRDYSGLVIDRGPYVLNVLKSDAFEVRRQLRKIGQAPDKGEWSMTPPTVNAYNNSSRNEVVFPAGILQPPFFDPKADDAVNYGGIGAVIGHEMTHGFDDQGRQYDGRGNLVDWWTKESAERFKVRADAIVKEFDGFFVAPGLHLNGRLTQGENIADLGGLKVAYSALEKDLGPAPREKIDGFTPEQRFFLSYATVWRTAIRPEEAARLAKIDPHSPAQFRVNGPLSNLDEFARAFDVPEGAPMRRAAADRVTIW